MAEICAVYRFEGQFNYAFTECGIKLGMSRRANIAYMLDDVTCPKCRKALIDSACWAVQV